MAPVAPLVAGHWPRRLGGMPGPYAGPGGSGDSPNGQVLQVELFVDGTWVDITSYVMTRDGSYQVDISRGQPDEATGADPGRCSFQLNNRDGRFSPRNPSGPYFGKLGRNQPLRISVPSGNAKSYRFWGEVAEWPQRWDTTGTDVWVEVQAAGILRRLGQGSAPIGSALYLDLTSVDSAANIFAYWPCEDGAGSTSIGPAMSGLQPMTISGTPNLAAFTSFECSAAIPTMGTASFTGRVPSYASTNQTLIEFLLGIPAAGGTAQVVCRFSTTGTLPIWEIYYDPATGGYLGLRGKSAGGVTVVDTGLGAGTVNGKLVRVIAALTADGPNLEYDLLLYEVGDEGPGGVLGGPAALSAGIVTSITIAPEGALTDTAVGHIAVRTVDPERLFVISDAVNAYAGEAAGTRISRLCETRSVSFDSVGTLSSTPAMGTQRSATFLDLVTQAADVDGGILYELNDALGLGYRTRISLENQSSVLALSYSGFNLAEVPTPVDDDQHTRNDITVTRTNGSSARATLSTGALSIQPAPAGIGQYDDSVTLNVEDDGDLPDQAGWLLHLGTVDEARYPQISVNLAHPTFVNNPTLRNQVLAVRPGDRITISGLPAWLPPDDISQIVLGYRESIDHFQHRITFNCRPESPYRVAVVDSATFARADTEGSQLAGDATATATSLSVATTTGVLWTTDPAEFPLDVRIAGEVITVGGITGSSSPQTFSPVTRSVNGVVKAQVAGTDVRLNQPATIAL